MIRGGLSKTHFCVILVPVLILSSAPLLHTLLSVFYVHSQDVFKSLFVSSQTNPLIVNLIFSQGNLVTKSFTQGPYRRLRSGPLNDLYV